MSAEKSLAKMHETALPMWKDYKWPVEAECADGTALDPMKAIVLHGKVSPNGDLNWKVPDGKWIIYRFGVAPTGAKNNPANPGASGYETDKMSLGHIASHFDAFIGKMLDETPERYRKAIKYAVMDSYEVGGQNFTDGFCEKFSSSFGYDPTVFLPALLGMAVSSRMDSDRFLWDLRRFVADEVAYSFVGGLRKASSKRGLGVWLENYGHWGFPGEFLQYGGQSDEVSGEFWCEGELGTIENRAASSCAHTYGKRLVWAESNTCVFRPLQRGPMDLKQRTDRFFTEGINATILHFYAHQPDDRKPGVFEGFGNEFHRNNTWFEHLDVFTGYLKRCGWMLRQGLNVADIAYFIGEDAPCMTGAADPAPPPGRQFDFINAEVLIETASVDEKGRIVLPHGTAYEVLVLPKLETMRPKMIECIERLVNAGAFVIGPKPKRSPSLAGQPQSDAKVKEIADRLWGADECKVESVKCKVRKYGKGVIASDISLEEALKMRGSEPDALFNFSTGSIAYAHRTMPNAEIYFVSNQSGEEMPSIDVSFRVAGRTPELWDAATGIRRVADAWREDGKRSAVTLSLAKHESVFVVFPKEEGNGGRGTGNGFNPVNPVNPVKDSLVPGPWTVSFESDALHRGPKEPIVMDKLIDLSTSPDPAIKFYSGRITYKTKFAVPRSPLPVPLFLSLGSVSVTAKVRVNGKYAGGVCFAPYRLDIAPFVKEGENELEIEVCNLWVNRLVGDEGLENRPTWASCKYWESPPPLPKSGLIGPVSILQPVRNSKPSDDGGWRVGDVNGAPGLLHGGKPVAPIMFWQWEPQESDVRDMAKAGVELFTMFGSRPHYEHPYWRKNGSLDMLYQDKCIDRLLEWSPEAAFLPRLFATAPDWWIAANPNEREGWHIGNGCAGRESFASVRCREEVGPMYRRAVRHLIDRYGDQMIGIHVANGPWGEHFLWDAAESLGMRYACGDTSEPMRQAFVRYLRAKYHGDPVRLRKAFGDPAATFDGVAIPTKEERMSSVSGAWRDPAKHRRVIDYFECLHETTAEMLDYYCGIVKDESGGRLSTLAFYGYVPDESWPHECDHRATAKMYRSKNLDMLSAPHTYHRRGLGQDGMQRQYLASAALHGKFFLDEGDDMTHLEMAKKNHDGRCVAHTMEDSLALLYREFGMNVTHGTGLWYMDLCGGNFRDPRLVDAVGRMKMWSEESLRHDRSHHSEVAVVSQPESAFYMAYRHKGDDVTEKLYRWQMGEFYRAGAPFDWYLADDLSAVAEGKAKVVAFLDCEYLSDAQYDTAMKLKAQGRRLVFFHAPGYAGENALSWDRVKRLTGGETFETPRYLRADELREIYKSAGVHVYTDADVVLSANSAWLMMHTRKEGDYEITLPRKARRIVEITTEKTVAKNADRFVWHLPKHATAVFLIGSNKENTK